MYQFSDFILWINIKILNMNKQVLILRFYCKVYCFYSCLRKQTLYNIVTTNHTFPTSHKCTYQHLMAAVYILLALAANYFWKPSGKV